MVRVLNTESRKVYRDELRATVTAALVALGKKHGVDVTVAGVFGEPLYDAAEAVGRELEEVEVRAGRIRYGLSTYETE